MKSAAWSRSRLARLGVTASLVAACSATSVLDGSEFDHEHASPTAELDSKLWSCSGLTGTTPSPTGSYVLTSFGCWRDEAGDHGDPGDNCIPACLGKPGYAELCGKKSGPECERSLNWYIADSDRFGCFSRVRVTNPQNGKSAVAVTLDRGPNCTVEKKAKTWVLDASTPVALHLFGEPLGVVDMRKVFVEAVDPSTPLGPSDDDTSTSASTGATTSTGGATGAGGGPSSASSSGSGGGGSVSEPWVIDDDDALNPPGSHFAASSNWTKSTNVSGFNGAGYRVRSVGATADAARFEFVLDEPQTLLVEARWTAASDRSATAPYLVLGASDVMLGKVLVDQRTQGGQWVPLGEFPFTAGTNAVALSRWTSGGGVVIADAVRLSPLD